MENKKLLDQNNNIFPIAKYNYKNFSKENCVAFTGTPVQHPYENDKFILITNPLSEHTSFFEFHKSDVISLEDLSNILSTKGESIHMTKIWIKQGVIALRYEPFIVGKTKDIIDKIYLLQS